MGGADAAGHESGLVLGAVGQQIPRALPADLSPAQSRPGVDLGAVNLACAFVLLRVLASSWLKLQNKYHEGTKTRRNTKRLLTSLGEGAQTRNRFTQDQRVDIVRPLVGFHRLEIAHVPDYRKFEADAIGSQDVS